MKQIPGDRTEVCLVDAGLGDVGVFRRVSGLRCIHTRVFNKDRHHLSRGGHVVVSHGKVAAGRHYFAEAYRTNLPTEKTALKYVSRVCNYHEHPILWVVLREISPIKLDLHTLIDSVYAFSLISQASSG